MPTFPLVAHFLVAQLLHAKVGQLIIFRHHGQETAPGLAGLPGSSCRCALTPWTRSVTSLPTHTAPPLYKKNLIFFAPRSDLLRDPLAAQPRTPGVLAQLVPSLGTCRVQKSRFCCHLLFFAPRSDLLTDPLAAHPRTPGVLAQLLSSLGTCIECKKTGGHHSKMSRTTISLRRMTPPLRHPTDVHARSAV